MVHDRVFKDGERTKPGISGDFFSDEKQRAIPWSAIGPRALGAPGDLRVSWGGLGSGPENIYLDRTGTKGVREVGGHAGSPIFSQHRTKSS